MKRIFVPTRGGTDWQRLLAQPRLHWKKGASAMTAAAVWEGADSALPADIASLFGATRLPALANLKLVAALPEWKVALPGGDTTSATDILAICRNDSGLCVVGVEAKVLEDFGPTLEAKRATSPATDPPRLKYLHDLLRVPRFSDKVRYQLLHRTASALLTAQEFHAGTAVMLVHAFDTPVDRRADFEAFAQEMGAVKAGEGIYSVPDFERPTLFLAWSDGDSTYRQVELPTVL